MTKKYGLKPIDYTFDWDENNVFKNEIKHNVHYKEVEKAFRNSPMFILDDIKNSDNEKRYMCLGKSNEGRLLFISFTKRAGKVRAISARQMNKKERRKYENTKT